MDIVFLTALLGAAGIGGLITAVVNAFISAKKQPVETKKLSLEGNLTLVTAAEALVGSQAHVVAARDKEIERLGAKMDAMEATIQKVVDELENERTLREEREHELEQHRLQLARQAEKIEQQGQTIRSQGGKITALKVALQKLGQDPAEIVHEEE